jgi:hypothetical protein
MHNSFRCQATVFAGKLYELSVCITGVPPVACFGTNLPEAQMAEALRMNSVE